MGMLDTSNTLAILAAGRVPEWYAQLGHDGTSGTDADGYPSAVSAAASVVPKSVTSRYALSL